MQSYSYLLPNIIYDILSEIISNTKSSQSQTVLSFSLILTLWAASGGVLATMRGMNKAYKCPEHRSFIRVRALSLFFTITLAFLMIILMITLVLGEVIGNYVFNNIFDYLGLSNKSNNAGLKNVWDIFRHILPVFFAFMVFLIIYKYMPSQDFRKQPCPSPLFYGWLVYAIIGFSYYVNKYTFSVFYGSIVELLLC